MVSSTPNRIPPKVNISNHQGNANPTTMWCHSTPVRMTNIKKTEGRELESVQSKPGLHSQFQAIQGYYSWGLVSKQMQNSSSRKPFWL